jgi:hypothetical protein
MSVFNWMHFVRLVIGPVLRATNIRTCVSHDQFDLVLRHGDRVRVVSHRVSVLAALFMSRGSPVVDENACGSN